MNDRFQTIPGDLAQPGLMQLDQLAFDDTLRMVLRRVYLWMALGLLLTAGTAYLSNVTVVSQILFTTPFLFPGLLIAELILVITLSAALNKLTPLSAGALFFAYAALNGVTLSAIFLAYEIGSVFMAFAITSSLFGAMTLIGYSTKKNLNNWGGYLFMGLFGMLVVSIVTMFIGNGMLDWLVSIVMVFIFLGLTIYDTQRIKHMVSYAMQSGDEDLVSKIGIRGALSLYLNFINLFLRILRLFGGRRR